MNKTPERLPLREFDALIDKHPSFQAKLKMHEHEVATRLHIEALERKAAEGSSEAAQQRIAAFVRELASGREHTVRGKTMLKVAAEIEDLDLTA